MVWRKSNQPAILRPSNKGIEQFKASQNQMAADNAQLKANQEQMARLIAKASEQNLRPKTSAPPRPTTAPARKPGPAP